MFFFVDWIFLVIKCLFSKISDAMIFWQVTHVTKGMFLGWYMWGEEVQRKISKGLFRINC